MKTFRVGIIGAGYVSAHHLRALQSVPSAQVVGIADLDRARAEDARRKFDLPAAYGSVEELLAAGVDAVHILTPPAFHAQVAIQCLQAGVHVLVEKPMAETPEDCERMMAAAQNSGRMLCLVHSGRLDPIILRGAEVAKSGAIGDVLSIDLFRSSDYAPWPGGGKLPPQYRKGSYPFQDNGIHSFAIAETFMGPVQSAQVGFRSTGRDSNLVFDEWEAEIECESGPARLYLSYNVRPIRNQVIVHGTKGVIHIDCFLQTCHVTKLLPGPKFASPVICAVKNSATSLVEVPLNVMRFLTKKLPGSPGIHRNVKDFYKALEEGLPAPVPPEEGLRLIRAMSKACDEADRQREELRAEQLESRPATDVLVTGAGGFLGGHLLQRLVEEGAQVRAAVRRLPKHPLPGVEYVTGDLGDPEYVDRLVADVSTVYHVGGAMKGTPADFERGNTISTRNMVNSSLKHGVKRFVYVSSISVLKHAGSRSGAVTEAWPLEPHADRRGAYAQTKLAAEQLVVKAMQEQNLPAVVIRPGALFGPGVEPGSPSGSFAMFGRWIVVGDGSLGVPLVYIDDAVDALLKGGSQAGIEGSLFNLVDPTVVTQRHFIDIAQASRPKIKAAYVPKPVLRVAAIEIERLGRKLKRDVPLSRYRIASIRPLSDFDQTAAKDVLGWTPSVGTVEGLRRTFPAAEKTAQ